MLHITTLLLLLSVGCEVRAQNNTSSVNDKLSVAVIFNSKSNCNASSDLGYSDTTLSDAAIWVTKRINILELIHPLKLSLSLHKTCSEMEFLKVIFQEYEKSTSKTIGVITTNQPTEKEVKFSAMLGMSTKRKKYLHGYMARAAVQFLKVMGWQNSVTLVAKNEATIDLFHANSKEKKICIKKCYVYDDPSSLTLNATGEDPLVFFGTSSDISQFLANDAYFNESFAAKGVLFVPFDGDLPSGLPQDSFVMLPSHAPSAKRFKVDIEQLFPTPLLFEIADPLLNFAMEARRSIAMNCDLTSAKDPCMALNITAIWPLITPNDVLVNLKIEPLKNHFVYNIFKVEPSTFNETYTNIYLKPFRKLYTYSMFLDNLTLVDEIFEPPFYNISILDDSTCSEEILIFGRQSNMICWLIIFRNDSWIYAFLSLALLGVIFCVAILVFLLFAIFQRRILEGNPSMTVLLLFAVMLVFCSVLPFTIQPTKSTHKYLCIVKTLSITLSYAAVFSLLLSRCIVLSSAAKEIGFMSHIAGQIQSFLCLFIFGVQGVLSLQVFESCNGIFTKSFDFLYLMSYNVILLVILVCLTPLIYRSQRNYREGKYFTITIVLLAVAWSVWLSCFAIFCSEWKEMMVCLGLVSTGAICLGAIFIPRTYLMTIAAERDKITSALPSLTNATSAMDLYRAHPQPIYDCINVAAINAATVARAGVIPPAPPTTNLQQPDLYSCPALPEDIDFELCCDSPTNADKVTRF